MNNIDTITAQSIVNQIKRHFNNCEFPEIGLVLGSGLGGFTQVAKTIYSMEYAQLGDFPRVSLYGHKGQFSIVEFEDGKRALVMEGRFHLYEGILPAQVTLPIVVMHFLGIKKIIISTVAGGISSSLQVGDLMIINDHINFTGNNPLIGRNDAAYGPRLLDLTEPYNKELIDIAKKFAPQCNVQVKEGVYLGVSGPTYETRAEVRAFHAIGADAVGMSTVHEVIVANYLGMQVLGIATITNMATGITQNKHDHINVVGAANQITEKFSNWVKQIILNI